MQDFVLCTGLLIFHSSFQNNSLDIFRNQQTGMSALPHKI
jgi:hypothetical protein